MSVQAEAQFGEWRGKRLVAKGFSQIFELDYFGTYAPVALAVLMCLTLASLNVEAAFMNDTLDE